MEGINNLEEIVSIEEIDGILIGPNDLSIDRKAIEKVADVCQKADLHYGIMASIEPPNKPIELCCNILPVGTIAGFVRVGGTTNLQ